MKRRNFLSAAGAVIAAAIPFVTATGKASQPKLAKPIPDPEPEPDPEPDPEPEQEQEQERKELTVALNEADQVAIHVWLNLTLRRCAPRYPRNESIQLSDEYATTLNRIYRKFTGHDHQTFLKWKGHLPSL